MAVTLTLTPSSGEILAAVDGMSLEYLDNRLFKWYLNGKLHSTELVEPCTYHEKYIGPAYQESWHTVRVEIFDPTGEELFADLSERTKTLIPVISPWNWYSSNGMASADQTIASYNALTNKELAVNFSRQVWNDLVNKIIELRSESGQTWLTNYETAQNMIMTSTKNSLSAKMFNAYVKNLGWSWWDWELKFGSDGYTGRRLMRGVSTMGDVYADPVYGAYLIELAKRLNTMIYIFTDTGPLSRMNVESYAVLDIDPYLLARHSAPMSRNTNIVLDITRNMLAHPSVRFGVNLQVVNSIISNLEAERYRLFVVSLLNSLGINSQIIKLPPQPFSMNSLVELDFTSNLQKIEPAVSIVDNQIFLTPSVFLNALGVSGVFAENEVINELSALLDKIQNAGVKALNPVYFTFQNRKVITKQPIPISTMTIGAVNSILGSGLVLPNVPTSSSVEVETEIYSTNVILPPKHIPIVNSEFGLSKESNIGVGEPIYFYSENISTLVSSPNLAKLQFAPLSAVNITELQISVKEGGEEPTDMWKQQNGDELTIWQSKNARQREDKVLVDIDSKPAEISASTSGSITTSAVIFVSKGWEFPRYYPNANGHILIVKQSIFATQTNEEVEVE